MPDDIVTPEVKPEVKPEITPEVKPDVVARADHDRAIADMLKFKAEAATLKAEKEAAETTRMKASNQWKEIAEAKEKEAETLKADNKRMQDSYLGDKKFNAVQAKCLALGLRAEAASDLEMLDLDAVTIETTSTGKVNVLGVDKFAERLKTLKPHWFADPKQTKINSDGTRVIEGGNGLLTPADLLAAEKEAKKTGDHTKYYNLHKQYQTQRLGAKRA